MFNIVRTGFGLDGRAHVKCTVCGWESRPTDNADDRQASKLVELQASHQCVADRRMQTDLRHMIGSMLSKGWKVVDRARGIEMSDGIGRSCTITQTEDGCELVIH